MFTSALDRVLPRLDLVSRRAGTLSASVSGILWNVDPSNNYFFYASVGTIAACLVDVVLCASSSVCFRRVAQRYHLFVHGLISVIGIAVFGLAGYRSVDAGAVPSAPHACVPYRNLGWLVLGILLVAYLAKTAPEKLGQICSILGDESGETAAIMDQPAAAPAGA